MYSHRHFSAPPTAEYVFSPCGGCSVNTLYVGLWLDIRHFPTHFARRLVLAPQARVHRATLCDRTTHLQAPSDPERRSARSAREALDERMPATLARRRWAGDDAVPSTTTIIRRDWHSPSSLACAVHIAHVSKLKSLLLLKKNLPRGA